ncbi:MAG: hypothetical protein AAFP22_08575, partial [Planctomycetota bacterium]
FRRVVTALQAQVPTADIAYGVGRFEDYGGPGRTFSGEAIGGRPFILNQAILSRSVVSFLPDLNGALANRAPGFGGDAWESSAGEALYQLATGAGFDGDGDGSFLGSGPSGALLTQVEPGTSGDVPPFSSYVGTGSGTEGGAGWRRDSLRIVILATDIAPVAPFESGVPVPPTIVGTGSVEPSSAFRASNNLGSARYGFVSDALTSAANTVPNAIAPRGAATIPQAITAVNSAGIRIIGLAPGGAPTSAPGPSNDPSVMLSALARMTGGVDSSGQPLIFDIDDGLIPIALGIVDAVLEISNLELDLQLRVEGAPAGLAVDVTPSVVNGVGPTESADFQVSITAPPGFTGGSFDLRYRDLTSGGAIATVPVTIECLDGCTTVDFERLGDFPLPNGYDAQGESFGVGLFAPVVTVSGTADSGLGVALFDTDPKGPNFASSDQDLLVGSGNALILQEVPGLAGDVYTTPDDDAFGGDIVFGFSTPIELCAVDLIDVDLVDSGDTRIVLSDEAGRERSIRIPGGFTEDIEFMPGTGVRRLGLGTTARQQGFQSQAVGTDEAGFDETRVVSMRVELAGSGALDNLMYRAPLAAPSFDPGGIVLGKHAQLKR